MIVDDSEQFQIVLRAGYLAVTLIMNFVGVIPIELQNTRAVSLLDLTGFLFVFG